MKLLNVFKERAPISVLITVFVACSRVGMAESAPGEPPNQMKASPGATPKNHLVVVPEPRPTGSSSSLRDAPRASSGFLEDSCQDAATWQEFADREAIQSVATDAGALNGSRYRGLWAALRAC